MIAESVIPRKETLQARPEPVSGLFAPPSGKDRAADAGDPAVKAAQSEQASEKTPVVEQNEELLRKVLEVVKDHASLRNIGFEFGFHEGAHRMTVTVMDRETDEIIRELPPEKLLDLVAKMEEMVGMLFDAKA